MIPCLMVSTTHLWWFGEWFQIHPRSHGILWIPWSGNFQVPRPDIHFELVGPVEDLPEIRPFDPRFFMPVRTWTKDGKEPKFPLNDTIYDIYKLNFNRIYIYMYIIYTCIYKMDSIHIYIYRNDIRNGNSCNVLESNSTGTWRLEALKNPRLLFLEDTIYEHHGTE